MRPPRERLTPRPPPEDQLASGHTHQVVAHNYARNRYLTLLTEEQLSRRVEDIMGNLHVIDDEGLVSFDPSDAHAQYALSLLTEVQIEMAIRHGPYPAGWRKGMVDFRNMPGSLNPSGPQEPRTLRPRTALDGAYLVKYGERKYLEPMLRQGRVRVSPASLYNDPSLNNAIRDDELTAELFHDPFVPFNEVAPGTMLLPAGRVVVRQELKTNYYVYCLADRLAMRLLLDFVGADSCLVIRDPESFLQRLVSAAGQNLPDWQPLVERVEYYDSLRVNPAEIQLLTWKHFRYAYQREVRVAWVPPQPVDELPYLELELGNLEDIAELVSPTSG